MSSPPGIQLPSLPEARIPAADLPALSHSFSCYLLSRCFDSTLQTQRSPPPMSPTKDSHLSPHFPQDSGIHVPTPPESGVLTLNPPVSQGPGVGPRTGRGNRLCRPPDCSAARSFCLLPGPPLGTGAPRSPRVAQGLGFRGSGQRARRTGLTSPSPQGGLHPLGAHTCAPPPPLARCPCAVLLAGPECHRGPSPAAPRPLPRISLTWPSLAPLPPTPPPKRPGHGNLSPYPSAFSCPGVGASSPPTPGPRCRKPGEGAGLTPDG